MNTISLIAKDGYIFPEKLAKTAYRSISFPKCTLHIIYL